MMGKWVTESGAEITATSPISLPTKPSTATNCAAVGGRPWAVQRSGRPVSFRVTKALRDEASRRAAEEGGGPFPRSPVRHWRGTWPADRNSRGPGREHTDRSDARPLGDVRPYLSWR